MGLEVMSIVYTHRTCSQLPCCHQSPDLLYIVLDHSPGPACQRRIGHELAIVTGTYLSLPYFLLKSWWSEAQGTLIMIVSVTLY